jgi:hypothetical protein
MTGVEDETTRRLAWAAMDGYGSKHTKMDPIHDGHTVGLPVAAWPALRPRRQGSFASDASSATAGEARPRKGMM